MIARLRGLCLALAPLTFARTFALSSAEVGVAGERVAERYLRSAGMKSLGRRVATRCGEIDLVLIDRGRLVCAEVKTSLRARCGTWDPGERWQAKAFARLRAAAGELRSRGLGRGFGPARLDLLEVWIGPPGTTAEIRHRRGLTRPLKDSRTA